MVFRSLPVLIGTAGPVMAVSAMAVSVMAGPLVCTTTLEASDPAVGAGAPVEVTRCEPVETTSELINRRFYSWTTPEGSIQSISSPSSSALPGVVWMATG